MGLILELQLAKQQLKVRIACLLIYKDELIRKITSNKHTPLRKTSHWLLLTGTDYSHMRIYHVTNLTMLIQN